MWYDYELLHVFLIAEERPKNQSLSASLKSEDSALIDIKRTAEQWGGSFWMQLSWVVKWDC